MKAFCAKQSEMDFNAVPVRGQSHKTVLITLPSIKNDEVVIDSMEAIDSESVAAATAVVKKMIVNILLKSTRRILRNRLKKVNLIL